MFQWFLARTMTMMMIDSHIFFSNHFCPVLFICMWAAAAAAKNDFLSSVHIEVVRMVRHSIVRFDYITCAQHVYSPAMYGVCNLCTHILHSTS